jgi:Tetracyclin repressor-like, C-terminal domain
VADEDVLGLRDGWPGAEFVLVGDGNRGQALFNDGSTLQVRTIVHSGSREAPGCVMRRLTGESNNLTLVGVPTLIAGYTYVPGKAELLDLMLDTIYAQMTRADLSDKPWRMRVKAVANENRDMYERHPWAAAISTSRPPLGPGLMTKYEHELTAFAGCGLDDVDMDAALTYLLSFVQASARSAAEAAAIRRASAMSDEQWWAVNAPFLARLR